MSLRAPARVYPRVVLLCEQFQANIWQTGRFTAAAALRIVVNVLFRNLSVESKIMKFRHLASRVALPCAAVLMASAASAATADVFSTVRAPVGVKFSAVAGTTPMRVILALPLRDAAGAAAFAAAVSDPKNALYGRYLTPVQYGARFGADAATYEYLRNWATSNGLAVGPRHESRATLSLGGTADQFARLFHTSFASFPTPTHGDGQVTLSAPRLPTELAGRVSGVIGLSSAAHYAPLARLPAAGPRTNVGTGLGGYYSPTDLRTAYEIPAQTSTAKTEIVGIFEQGGYKYSDITTYQKEYGVSTTLDPISVDGSSIAPNYNVELEDDLDIDVITGMNPSVAEIQIYEDAKDAFNVALLDALEQMASDDTSKVISISYGQDEIMEGMPAIEAENTAFTELVSQGQGVFVSSGDDGGVGRTGSGLNAFDPASQPMVTAVGGTTMNTVTPGGAWASEVVWNELATGEGATGGGVSMVWSIPSYQLRGGVLVALANGGSGTMRNEPDIAADADPYTGYSVYCALYGGWIGVGGTSLSSPLWAGMTSIVNADRVAAGLPRVGFINPELYEGAYSELGFHDITVGNNGSPGYTAGPKYDNDTGWGSLILSEVLPKLLVK
jgi:subtilase family serine protease